MPVTVVVGGQYGSEGKGKVAHFLARELHASFALRVGGPNSGHTVVDALGNRSVFRQLPTAAVLPGVRCIIGAGSYIDLQVLHAEINACRLTPERLYIDPRAVVLSPRDGVSEQNLMKCIGSTASGTGAGVLRRAARLGQVDFAGGIPGLRPYVRPTVPLLRAALTAGDRVIIEGTQGYGLSVLHGSHYPYVTSRDTTAAGFLSEAGLSPLDVDDVTLVLRAYPIRVGGDSGPLENETTWQEITRSSRSLEPLVEYTTVTKRLRRVARFDCELVRRAIESNCPTHIVLNHLDYVDSSVRDSNRLSSVVIAFLEDIQLGIQRKIDLLGTSESRLLDVDARHIGSA